jgi:hypothetical protein
MRDHRTQHRARDGFVRETFTQPRDDARQTVREFLDRYPKPAYMSEVEHWRELSGGEIEFTMRRLRTAVCRGRPRWATAKEGEARARARRVLRPVSPEEETLVRNLADAAESFPSIEGLISIP